MFKMILSLISSSRAKGNPLLAYPTICWQSHKVNQNWAKEQSWAGYFWKLLPIIISIQGLLFHPFSGLAGAPDFRPVRINSAQEKKDSAHEFLTPRNWGVPVWFFWVLWSVGLGVLLFRFGWLFLWGVFCSVSFWGGWGEFGFLGQVVGFCCFYEVGNYVVRCFVQVQTHTLVVPDRD